MAGAYPKGERNDADLINEVSLAIDHIDDTEQLLETVLELIHNHGFAWAALKVADPRTGEIRIHNSSGLSDDQMRKGRYRLGEGVTGTVFETGEPVVIPHILEDRRYLNRTGSATEDGAFYCYPIKNRGQVLGALSALSPSCSPQVHRHHVNLFTVLVPIITQSFRIAERIWQEREGLQEENRRLRQDLGTKRSIGNLVGRSSKMLAVLEQIEQVAPTGAIVLISGEGGSGKEMVADAIHFRSPRKDRPMLKVCCADAAENMLDGELFGYENGVLSGTVLHKRGKIEMAEGGTLLLDEVGALPRPLQTKLLRYLQEREFQRLGGSQTFQSDVRIIATTHGDLGEAVARGEFREDLFYRLNVFPIRVPPLRERKTDIILLANFFLQKYNDENHLNVKRLSTPAIDLLMSYHWPGNVRELENCIERAVISSKGDTLRAMDMPPSLQVAENDAADESAASWSLPQAVVNLEKEMIYEALKQTKGHQGLAARKLGITERQLGYKMAKYNIVRSAAAAPANGTR